MVELRTKMTESGVLYVPKEVREAFGRELVIVPNSCAVVMFRKGMNLRHVLGSLEIITLDLKHRLEVQGGYRNEGVR